MITDFEGKVAVITGGGHGIGRAIAGACLNLGMKVALTASRTESAQAAASELDGGDDLMALASDAGDLAAIEDLARQVEQRWGRVGLLCLNAGISRLCPVPDMSIEDWDQHMAVNLNGPVYATKVFLPLLQQQEQAHIVFTSSVFGLFAGAMQAPYFASKAGLNAFAETLFYDLAAAGSSIGVSLLCPGNVNTNMVNANLTGDEPEELVAAIREVQESGMSPDQVAEDVMQAIRSNQFYVLSNAAEYQPCIDAKNERIHAGRNPAWEDIGETV